MSLFFSRCAQKIPHQSTETVCQSGFALIHGGGSVLHGWTILNRIRRSTKRQKRVTNIRNWNWNSGLHHGGNLECLSALDSLAQQVSRRLSKLQKEIKRAQSHLIHPFKDDPVLHNQINQRFRSCQHIIT